MSKYLTAPPPTDRMPPGIPYIVGNEAAERFSFYGMKAILTVFMTTYLLDASGAKSPMSDEDAKYWVHTFVVAAYFFPLLGAVIADWLLGKYRTILWLSVVYCLGHLSLALDDTRLGLAVGLSLIAIGTGAIKPCVSSTVGDQFGPRNAHLLSRVYGWFYLSINLGAFVSTILTPILLDRFGPHVAFAVPGVLMALATVIFWAGRNRFVHVPPRGRDFLRELTSREVLGAIGRLIPIYICIAAFWCLFDQTASAWVLQAEDMNRAIPLPDALPRPLVWLLSWTGGEIKMTAAGRVIEYLPSQLQAANPALILILVPIFSYVIYPAIDRVWRLTPLRKIGLGMFLTVPAFTVSALIQRSIDHGGAPGIGWQVLAYVILTAAEVMVSITSLEFSYTQAPPSMKSIVMSVYLLSVSLGNELTAVVNAVIQNPDGTTKLPGASYYWFFTGVMAAAAVAYVFVATFYRGKTYIQPEASPEPLPLGEARCPVCGAALGASDPACPACGEPRKPATPIARH